MVSAQYTTGPHGDEHETAAAPASSWDNRVVFHGVSWQQLEHVLDARGDAPGVRLTYLQGELELMSSSTDHEIIKTTIGRLLEAATEELGLDFNGVGSWTIRKREVDSAAEPDECYVVGPLKGRTEPDLAIEVVWTTGGIDKLEVYRRLGVREVWFWEAGLIRVFLLVEDRYDERPQSEILPSVDLKLIGRLATHESQAAAVRDLRAHMRAR